MTIWPFKDKDSPRHLYFSSVSNVGMRWFVFVGESTNPMDAVQLMDSVISAW